LSFVFFGVWKQKLFGFGYFQVCKLLNNVPWCLATQKILFGVICK
jgi:hypothetical protein